MVSWCQLSLFPWKWLQIHGFWTWYFNKTWVRLGTLLQISTDIDCDTLFSFNFVLLLHCTGWWQIKTPWRRTCCWSLECKKLYVWVVYVWLWGGYFCMCMGLFLHVYVWCVCVCVCVWERESMHVWKCVCVCVHVWGWRGWGYSIQWIWDHRIICVCTETWHQVHLHPVWWSHFSHLGGLWEDWHPGGGHKAWGKLAISLSPTHPSFFCLFLFCWCVNYIFQYFIVPCIKFR